MKRLANKRSIMKKNIIIINYINYSFENGNEQKKEKQLTGIINTIKPFIPIFLEQIKNFFELGFCYIKDALKHL